MTPSAQDHFCTIKSLIIIIKKGYILILGYILKRQRFGSPQSKQVFQIRMCAITASPRMLYFFCHLVHHRIYKLAGGTLACCRVTGIKPIQLIKYMQKPESSKAVAVTDMGNWKGRHIAPLLLAFMLLYRTQPVLSGPLKEEPQVPPKK